MRTRPPDTGPPSFSSDRRGAAGYRALLLNHRPSNRRPSQPDNPQLVLKRQVASGPLGLVRVELALSAEAWRWLRATLTERTPA
jgi:hypothetical protein